MWLLQTFLLPGCARRGVRARGGAGWMMFETTEGTEGMEGGGGWIEGGCWRVFAFLFGVGVWYQGLVEGER